MGMAEKVDIWAIGYLIQTSEAARQSVEMMRLGAHICEESHELSAKEVLVLLAARQLALKG